MKTTEEILKQIRKLKRKVKLRKTMPDEIRIAVRDVGSSTVRTSFKVSPSYRDEIIGFLFDKSLRYSIEDISFSGMGFYIDLDETHEEIDIDTWRGNTYVKGTAYVVKNDTNITSELLEQLNQLLMELLIKRIYCKIDDKDIFKDVDDRDIFNDPSTI